MFTHKSTSAHDLIVLFKMEDFSRSQVETLSKW